MSSNHYYMTDKGQLANTVFAPGKQRAGGSTDETAIRPVGTVRGATDVGLENTL